MSFSDFLNSLPIWIASLKSQPQPMPSNCVAAGNPGKSLDVLGFDYTLPATIKFDGKDYRTKDTLHLLVYGSSMSPEDVFSGDIIVVSPCKVDEIKQGDYIVIEVDKKYYKHKYHRDPIFQYKLRKALMPVPQGEDADDTEKLLLDKLSKIYEELSLEEFTEDLKIDLRDALEYYNNDPLFVSITYKKGKIHYSFHPQSSIKYRVIQIVRKNFNNVLIMQPDQTLH